MQSAIFSANIIPSLFAPWHWANILGLQKPERSGKPNCVSFAFGVLCTCGINYSAILQQFKGKFENVYCCISFAFSRFSTCALEFLKFIFIYMPVGLRTWHRVNSAADRVKPSLKNPSKIYSESRLPHPFSLQSETLTLRMTFKHSYTHTMILSLNFKNNLIRGIIMDISVFTFE